MPYQGSITPTGNDKTKCWVDAMLNEQSSLLKLKKIYACSNHFECKWKGVKGGK